MKSTFSFYYIILYIKNEIMYAIKNWLMTIFVAFFIPNSFFIIPIVAIQGVYSNINIRKLIAELLVNIFSSTTGNTVGFEFVNTLNVLNIASLAEIPTIIDVTILQSENPSGLNIHDIFFPIIASMLCLSGTYINSELKLFRNHIINDAINITENDLIKNSFVLLHIKYHVFFNDGILYFGNSIINVPSPFFSFLLVTAVIIIPIIIPIPYNAVIASAGFSLKNIDTNIAYIGIFAEQLINGTSIKLKSRSLLDWIVLIESIAGTEHPKPNNIGTMLFPDKPILLNGLSIMKAILVMYPLSSNIDKKKYSVTIIGKKLITLPIPFNTPSVIRLFAIWLYSCISKYLIIILETISIPWFNNSVK